MKAGTALVSGQRPETELAHAAVEAALAARSAALWQAP